jgi:hypothetical protein
MRKRGSEPLTGADHLIMSAQSAVDSGLPYSDVFRDMLYSAVVPHGADALLLEMIASRPLVAHEAGPATIIDAAVQVALEQRDAKGALEATILGVALLAKWPDYLAAIDQHPTLTARD